MAEEAISYDKAELRAIVRSFKAMDDEAVSQAKEKTSELADYVRGKIIRVQELQKTRSRQRSPKVQRFPNLQKLVRSVLVLQGKNLGAAAQRNNCGAGTNSVQTVTSNSQCGQVAKVAGHAVGLFIQPYAVPNLRF
jgi:hypothetical protein